MYASYRACCQCGRGDFLVCCYSQTRPFFLSVRVYLVGGASATWNMERYGFAKIGRGERQRPPLVIVTKLNQLPRWRAWSIHFGKQVKDRRGGDRLVCGELATGR